MIRKGVESFVGPLTLSELQAKLEKMSFAPDDEIAGSCKSWTALSRASSIKRNYPEIASQIAKCQEVWSGDSVTKKTKAIVSMEKRRKKTKGKNTSHTTQYLILSFFLIVLSLLIWVNRYRIDLKAIGGLFNSSVSTEAAAIAELEQLRQSGDEQGLGKKIEEHLPDWSKRVTSSNKSYNLLMPWVRLYAFRYGRGSINGYELKYLKGKEPTFTPKDCSVDTWKSRWQEARMDLQTQVSEERLKEKTWYQILFWDARWIRRRPSKVEWIDPINFYEACLDGAYKSLAEFKQETTLVGTEVADFTWIDQRISQQIAIIAQKPYAVDWGVEGIDRITHPLGVLVCLDESVKDLPRLSACLDFSKATIPATSWIRLHKLYRELNHYVFERKSLINFEFSKEFLALSRTSPLGFSYQPEIELIELLKNTSELTEEQMNTLRKKYGGINLFSK